MNKKFKITKITPSQYGENQFVVSMSSSGNSPVVGLGRSKGVFTIFDGNIGDIDSIAVGTEVELPVAQIKTIVGTNGKPYDWFMA
jgi:hypothetical protein